MQRQISLASAGTAGVVIRSPSSTSRPLRPSVESRAPLEPRTLPYKHNQSFWKKYCFNSQKGTCCARTPADWGAILTYSIFYLLFLITFTMILLYISLFIIKSHFKPSILISNLHAYTDQNGIGLTVVPMVHLKYPLIWYKNNDTKQYQKYVDAITNLLSDYRKDSATIESSRSNTKPEFNVSSLDECSIPPYGYNALRPCVYVRVNRQIGWSARSMTMQSPHIADAPLIVKELVEKQEPKLWMHCEGYYPWDRQHIGNIKYSPDPPGMDASYFPYRFNGRDQNPLIAVQLLNFTLDVTISVRCKLWDEFGSSSPADFSIYVGRTRENDFSSNDVHVTNST